MLIAALKLSLLYWLLGILDTAALGWQALTRPIVVCPLVGILLGDVTTGCILGASLESLFMGISAIGGSIPADATTTSYVATAFVILTGADIESAVAIAMPIGTVLASVTMLPYGLFSPIQGFFTKLLQDNKIKQYEIAVWVFTFISPLINTVILFGCIYFGVDALQLAIASLPAWVMTGLGAVSSMALAVGFAILTSQIMNKETVIWFFVGFVLVKSVSLDTVAVAVIGAAVAITIFLLEKKIIENKGKPESKEEEEFF